MVESRVNFKREGKLPEVMSNTELRSLLYFPKANLVAPWKRLTEGEHGNGKRRLATAVNKQEEIWRGWLTVVYMKIRGKIRARRWS